MNWASNLLDGTAAGAMLTLGLIVLLVVLIVVLRCDLTLLKYNYRKYRVRRGLSVWSSLKRCKKVIAQIAIASMGLGFYAYAMASEYVLAML